MAQYQLVMHTGPTPGKTFLLEGDVLTIGREASNPIAINDAEISRKHSQLVAQGGKYVLTDLGSTNGTFVNGQRLTGQHVLQPGEVISLGEQISLLFEVITTVDPNATLLSSKPPVVAPRPQPQVVQPQPVAYAGQSPAGPSPVYIAPPPAEKKSNSTMIVIIVIAGILLLLCACAVGVYLWNAPCTLFQPFVGGVCP